LREEGQKTGGFCPEPYGNAFLDIKEELWWHSETKGGEKRKSNNLNAGLIW